MFVVKEGNTEIARQSLAKQSGLTLTHLSPATSSSRLERIFFRVTNIDNSVHSLDIPVTIKVNANQKKIWLQYIMCLLRKLTKSIEVAFDLVSFRVSPRYIHYSRNRASGRVATCVECANRKVMISAKKSLRDTISLIIINNNQYRNKK